MLRSNLEEVQLCLTAGERSEPAGKRFLLTPTPTGSNRMHVGKFDPFEVAQGQAIDAAGAASRHQTVKHGWTVSPSAYCDTYLRNNY